MIYNDYYSVYVSKDGLVFKVKDDKLVLCNMVPDRDGYYRVSLSRMSQYAKEHKGRHCVHVHKIIAHTFLGEQGNLVVDHIDRNRKNNSIDNLHYCTKYENAQNMKSMKGENNPMYGKNAWEIAASRKTTEQIEATRKSKSEKMKAFWTNNPEAKEQMAKRVSEAKRYGYSR